MTKSQHATKKSPAQLQREIDETIAKRATTIDTTEKKVPKHATMKTYPRLRRNEWLHGTSTIVWDALKSGRSIPIQRVFRETNVSLGGAYLTKDSALAKVYADNAATYIGGDPIVLVVKEQFPLLPDEDLAARLTDYRIPETKDRRLRAFVDALFADPNYFDGVALSDIYRDRYDELNDEFGITWKDSLKYVHGVRQKQPLQATQVVGDIPNPQYPWEKAPS